MRDLSHDSYRELLDRLGRGGRPVVAFRDLPAAGPYAILRHDVDFSLVHAVEIARIDAEAGATSTVFVMLSSPYYSPLEPAGRAAMAEIRGLGHEIGLHYDSHDFDGLDDAAARAGVARQAAILGEAAGDPVRAVAQHRPSRGGRPRAPAGFVDAYHPAHFTDIGYISDSRGLFREPDPLGYADRHDRLQVLTHPIWWSPQGLGRRAALERLAPVLTAGARDALAGELRHLGLTDGDGGSAPAGQLAGGSSSSRP